MIALHKKSAFSRRSRRLTIAQHFSAGRASQATLQSAQRTGEFSKNFSRPLRGLVSINASEPSTKVLGYCPSSRFAGLHSDFLCKVDHDQIARDAPRHFVRLQCKVLITSRPPACWALTLNLTPGLCRPPHSRWPDIKCISN
jgi:hypothetical protein